MRRAREKPQLDMARGVAVAQPQPVAEERLHRLVEPGLVAL
jgi:hypothetical protein